MNRWPSSVFECFQFTRAYGNRHKKRGPCQNYCTLENTINHRRLWVWWENIFHFIHFKFWYLFFPLFFEFVFRDRLYGRVDMVAAGTRKNAYWIWAGACTGNDEGNCHRKIGEWNEMRMNKHNEWKTKIMKWKLLYEVWWRWSWNKKKLTSPPSCTRTHRDCGQTECGHSEFLMEISWKFMSDKNNNNVYFHLMCTQCELFYFHSILTRPATQSQFSKHRKFQHFVVYSSRWKNSGDKSTRSRSAVECEWASKSEMGNWNSERDISAMNINQKCSKFNIRFRHL